jgi:2-hydroxychromene-2-carboxylate isomerase
VGEAREAQPIFYYDLGSPACYLAAERVMAALPEVPEWEPVLAADLALAPGEPERTRVEQAATLQGLQPIRWPARWPPDARLAARAATYAKQIGRAVAFSLACFRQVFAAGRDLGETDTMLIAAAACEIRPTAMLRAIELRSVQAALDAACSDARDVGVTALPAIRAGAQLFQGERAVERAAAALGAAA